MHLGIQAELNALQPHTNQMAVRVQKHTLSRIYQYDPGELRGGHQPWVQVLKTDKCERGETSARYVGYKASDTTPTDLPIEWAIRT